MVAVEELIALFAGELAPEGGYLTEPFPTVALAVRICELAQPYGLADALRIVYGDLPADLVSWRQANTLAAGFHRWQRAQLKLQTAARAGRGL